MCVWWGDVHTWRERKACLQKCSSRTQVGQSSYCSLGVQLVGRKCRKLCAFQIGRFVHLSSCPWCTASLQSPCVWTSRRLGPLDRVLRVVGLRGQRWPVPLWPWVAPTPPCLSTSATDLSHLHINSLSSNCNVLLEGGKNTLPPFLLRSPELSAGSHSSSALVSPSPSLGLPGCPHHLPVWVRSLSSNFRPRDC